MTGGSNNAEFGPERRAGLTVVAQVGHNAYSYMIDDKTLADILARHGEARAASIMRNHTAQPGQAPRGVYPSTSLCIVLLNMEIWPWTPPREYLLGAVSIGPDGEDMLPEALCEAYNWWRIQNGYRSSAVGGNPLLRGKGNLRYSQGGGVGTFPFGARGLAGTQGQFEASKFEADVAHELAGRRTAWEETTGAGSPWLTTDGGRPQIWCDLLDLAGPRVTLQDTPYGP